jgi:autotransporter-associated beta strand protein
MSDTILATGVTSESALNAAIASANTMTAGGTYEIDLAAGTIDVTAALTVINLAAGVTLDIEGAGATLDGGGAQRGLFVYSGAVSVANLTIQNMLAQGGSGGVLTKDPGGTALIGGDAGGGAGLGGGLFIADNVAGGAAAAGAVTLDNVTFSGDAAVGGNGSSLIPYYSPGYGGGLDANGSGVPAGTDRFGQSGYAATSSSGFGAGGPGLGWPFYTKHNPYYLIPQAAGFGGGGGAQINGAVSRTLRFGTPGFGGAIAGSNGTGGGGLGAGGDIFVQSGASLTIEGTSSIGAGSVTGGTTHGPAQIPAPSGYAFANGIYMQGNGNAVTFSTTGTETVAGVIGDDTGAAAAAGYYGPVNPQTGVSSYTQGVVGLALSGGTLILTGNNLYTGGSRIDSGTLQIGAGGTLGAIEGNVSVAAGGGLAFDRSDSVSFAGSITGAGVLLQQGSGTLSLTGSSNFSGGTTIDSGTLRLGNGGATGAITGAISIASGATLAFDSTQTFAAGALSGGGAVRADAGTLRLAVANPGLGASAVLAINSGTLDIAGTGVAGNATIAFTPGVFGVLKIEAGDAPANTIAGFAPRETIDLAGIGLATGETLTTGGSVDTLLITGGSLGPVTLNLAPGAYSGLTLESDGAGGTDLVLPFEAASEADLNAALADIMLPGGPAGDSFIINLTSNITLTAALNAIDLLAGDNLTINGNGFTLDGGGSQHGLFVYSGSVTVNNLAINDMLAQGGNGANGGGGGAGLGGGLFIADAVGAGAASAGSVTLNNVSFANDAAAGGNGGAAGTLNGSGGTLDGGASGTLSLGGFGNGGSAGAQSGSGGGFGGGGGAASGAGGFGAAAGTAGAGGGGLAGGGDVFVQSGASLTIEGTSSIGAGSLTAGNGAQAFGSGIYLQGGGNALSFSFSGTETAAGAISDDAGAAAASGYAGAAGYSEGSTGLALSGGTLILTGNDSYTGGSTITSGTLQIGAGGTLGAFVGAVSIAAGALLAFDRSDTTSFAGAISGAGALAQAGPGTLVLTGTAANTGGISVSAGTLQVGNGGTLGAVGGAVSVAAGAALAYDLSNTSTSTATVSGAGGLIQEGPGRLIVAANESDTGGTTLEAGTLQIGTGGTVGAIVGTVSIAGAGTLAFDRSDTVSYGMLSGAGSVAQMGSGTLRLLAADSYAGGTTIEAGTLDIGNAAAAGTGVISFLPGAAGVLKIEPGATPANTIADFVPGETIDLAGIGLATGTSFASGATIDTLTLTGGSSVVTLNLAHGVNSGFVLTSDGAGGTLLESAGSFSVGTEAALNAALTDIAQSVALAGGGTYAINLTSNITLTTALDAIDLPAGFALTINGNGFTLDGGGSQHGLFVYSGSVTVNNLAINDMLAQGGNGANGGGGGAGLGGGLFIADAVGAGAASAGSVTLNNVSFANDAAAGGNGGAAGTLNGSGGTLDGGASGTLSLGGFGNGGSAGAKSGSGGGFGGGGGAGGAASGAGGFGAAAGTAGAGGGGLAGGGDVFVQSGASLTIEGTSSIGAGSLTAGNGAQAFGSGIYLQGGGNALSFSFSGTETAAGAISDDAGAAAASGYAGAAGYSKGSTGLALSGGTLILTGNDSYTGGSTITSGTLQIGAGGTLGAIVGAVSIATGALLAFDRGDTAGFAGAISGAGALAQAGPGTLVLTGTAANTGGISVSAGTLQVGNGGTLGAVGGAVSVAAGAALAYDLSTTVTLAATPTGAGGLIQAGPGQLIVAANESYTGGTTLEAGTLQIGTGGTVGAIVGTVSIAGAGTLAFDRSDAISYGALAGATTLEQSGTGTLTLASQSSFSGGLVLNAGTVVVATLAAAGTGTITFGTSANATLKIARGAVPANLITGFNGGDTIDLAGIGLATAATIIAANSLQITGGSSAVTLALSPGAFKLQSDGAGGTDIVGLTDTAPAVSGVQSSETIAETGTIAPFSGVTIAASTPYQTVTATVALSTTANGTLSNLGGGTLSNGVYAITGTGAQVSAAIDGLIFTPLANEAGTNGTVATGLTLGANDDILSSTTATMLTTTGLIVDPTITATTAAVATTDEASVNPFAGVSISDPNGNQTETASVSFANANGTLADPNAATDGGSFSNGVYTVTGSAAAIATALDGLVFTPTAHQVYPTSSVVTPITATVTDPLGASATLVSSVTATAVLDQAIITMPGTVFHITDNETLLPFQNATLSDTDVKSGPNGHYLGFGILDQAYFGVSGTINGTFTLPNQVSGITYGFPASSLYAYYGGGTSPVQNVLREIEFTPLAHQVAPGQVTVSYFDVSSKVGSFGVGSPSFTGLGNPSLTVITIDVTAVASPITLTETPGIVSTTDAAATAPFAGVALTDVNFGQVETASVTWNTANGMLSDPNAASDGGVFSNGTYTVTGSASAVAAALDGLMFTPTAHQVAPGGTVATQLTATVTDTAAQTASITSTVVATALNDTPSISGAVANQTVLSGGLLHPLSGIVIADPDAGVTDSVTLTLTVGGTPSDANGVLSGAGLTETAAGVYTVAAGTPGALTAELEALQFTPSGVVANGQTLMTNLLLSVTQGGQTANNANTSVDQVACYCRGTLMLTDHGEVAVEDLRIGDRLVTLSGVARPIRWIGRRGYAGRFAAANPDVLPVLIRAGALDQDVPRRDLYVSPLHAMFLDSVLIPAMALVNDRSIVRVASVEQVEYFHLELDSHDVLLAEGAPAESFVDDESRGMFHNAAEYRTLYPDALWTPPRFCAPRVEDGEELEVVRRRLAARATATGPCPPHAQADTVAGTDDCPPVWRSHLDLVSHDRIEGWVQDAAAPDARVVVRILDNGRMIGRVLADGFRQDLAQAGIGDGRHSFSFQIAPGLSLCTRHVIEVLREVDAGALDASPKVLEPIARAADATVARADEPTADRPTADGPTADEPRADATATPSHLCGSVDTASREVIEGWAWDEAQPDEPVRLCIRANGTEIGRVVANRYRKDLAEAGIGSGRHAFQLRIPGGLPPHMRHVIEVQYAATGEDVAGSPRVFEASAGFDGAVESSIAAIVGGLTAGAAQDRALSFLAAQVDRMLQQRAEAEGHREARLAHQQYRRRWGEAPAAADGPAGQGVAVADPGRRALVVDDLLPDAARDAGSSAILSHMRALRSLGYAVSFVAALPPGGDRPATSARETAALEAALEVEGIACCRRPFYASVEEVLQRQAHCFDVVYLHRISNASKYLALVRQHCPRARVLYSVADLHHLRVAGQAQIEARPELLAEGRRLRLLECTAAWSADAVLTHSTHEAELLRQVVPSAKVHVVPWTQAVRPGNVPCKWRQGVAFIGGYAHRPNVDAAQWLVQDIMPLVWRQDPAIGCLLVGSQMPEAIQRLAQPGVTVLGPVADLATVFDRVRLTVAPLRYGAGVKGKVLASLAAGIPCVMSPVAAEGIDLPPLLAAATGGTAEDLAAQIVRLHGDGRAYRATAKAGVSLIANRFDEASVATSLRAAIEGRPKGGAAPVVRRLAGPSSVARALR